MFLKGEICLCGSRIFIERPLYEKFKEAFLSESTLETVEEINAIQKRMAHIPFNPESTDYKKFMEATQAKVSALTKKYPDITF